MSNNFSWNWLCSKDSFHLIDNRTNFLDDCFIESIFLIPTYILFLVLNSYLYATSRNIPRHFKHISIAIFRFISINLFFLSLFNIYFKYFYNSPTKSDNTLSSATILSDILQLGSYTLHTTLLLNKNVFIRNSKLIFISILALTAFNSICLADEILKLKQNTLQTILENILTTALALFFLLSYSIIFILSQCVTYFKFPQFSRNPRLGDNIQFDSDQNLIVVNNNLQVEQLAEEDKSNYFSYITLSWLQNVMSKGYKRRLDTVEDLSRLPGDLNIKKICQRFISKYSKKDQIDENEQKNPIINPEVLISDYEEIARSSDEFDLRFSNNENHISKKGLIVALAKCFGRKFILLGIFKVLNDSLNFAGPLLLNKIVEFVETKNSDLKVGCMYASALFLCTFFSSIINTHFTYSLNKLCLRVRTALVGLIYRKAVVVQTSELNNYSLGQIVNFMSIDSDTIVNVFPSIHAFWSLPFQICITLYLLYSQIGISFLVGLGFVLLLIPINKVLSDYIGKIHTKLMASKDSRVKIITEFLHGIRVIKFYTWENYFMNKINEVREKELKQLKAKKYLDAFCVYFWATTPILISVFTFMTYVWLGNQLTPSKVFTSLALFNMLIAPLNSFPWVINGLVQGWVSLKRVQEFLNLKNLKWLQYYKFTSDENSLIKVTNASFKWEKNKPTNTTENESNKTKKHKNTDENGENSSLLRSPDGSITNGTNIPIEQPVLSNISFTIENAKLIGVIGKVGSGKSSFLQTILSEISKISGSVEINAGICAEGFAYVSQDSWIQASTIRENILFGKEYDALKYQGVIEACALNADLQLLPRGDETPVGENGVTLSGGQKARLCLARACYQDKPIYLLDDPLSAVDAHVAKHIYDKCINGILRRKCRILCTHHLKYLLNADHVIVIENGEIVQQGDADDIIPEFMNAYKTLATDDSNNETDNSKNSSETDDERDVKVQGKIDEAIKTKDLLDEVETSKRDEEEKERGVISFAVYKHYCVSIGVCLTAIVLISLAMMQASRNATDWWLSYWTEHHSAMKFLSKNATNGFKNNSSDDNIGFFFAIYGSLCAANSCMTLIRAFSFAYSCILAGKYIHRALIENLMQAPIRFFDTTPRGRILNRVSSDMYAIDDSLPFVLNIFLACFIALCGILVVTCYSLPWFTLSLIPLALIYYTIQNYYRWTSRELKRLTSVLLSPIYTHFHETLAGLVTIRSFRQVGRFLQQNEAFLKNYIRASYVGMAASQWLNFRLQMIGVVMVTIVGFTGVLQHTYGNANASLLGLALSYILSVTGLLNGLISCFTETEKEMVSVERTHQFHNLDKENWSGTQQVESDWPSSGLVRFVNVVLRYQENAPNALNGINLRINSGEKIGIVGRTGSGKSSLFMALFRAVELSSGQIFIDNVNVRNIDLVELRKRMSIIPQDPFLFSGSLRENLDPNKVHSDAEIFEALRKCRLESKLAKLDKGLDSIVEEKGKNFSSGEKQLVCLARAILARTKILCIDEATASVDFETDNFIQETIRDEFKQVTVLTIAHRINTIFDYDKVIVMRNGEIGEFDSVRNLMDNKESQFYELVKSEQQQQVK